MMRLIRYIVSDYAKHKKYGGNFFVIVFLTQGFWATCQYRVANSIYYGIRFKPMRYIVLIPFYLWQKCVEIFAGISIPASAKIGDSFYIGHFGGIILNADAVIGNNCNISQGVSIGVSGQGEKRGVPVIGNNVYVGANAVIAGKIKVGNNCLIGACSLVNQDVPDNAMVMGVPSKVFSFKSSKGYI
jgi:serine O-acetyltransferase